MKDDRVKVPIWFLLAMLASVAAISVLMIFVVAEGRRHGTANAVTPQPEVVQPDG